MNFRIILPPAGTLLAGSQVPPGQEFPYPDGSDKSRDQSKVKAYLNYLVFDKDGNPILEKCGYEPVTDLAAEDGEGDVNGGDHQKLSKTITITEPGLVYIYLSNDNPVPFDVFFDDFKVEHIQSPIIQADDYYPFGLSFNSYKRENNVGNKYLYQGKELQEELGLDVFDFEWRMYDPAIGRTFQQDPHADGYFGLSPYSWVANNPIRLIDPDGRDWKTCEDEEMANQTSKGFENREKQLARKEGRIQKRLDKAENKGDTGRAEKLTAKKENVSLMREDMAAAQQEIADMGTDDKIFTFNKLGEDATEGFVSTDADGTVVINHPGDKGNTAHELKHASQVQRGLLVGEPGTNLFVPNGISFRQVEVQAYQRQYSAGYALPKSGFRAIGATKGPIRHVSTPRTFKGIGSSSLYLRGIYTLNIDGSMHQPYYNPRMYSR